MIESITNTCTVCTHSSKNETRLTHLDLVAIKNILVQREQLWTGSGMDTPTAVLKVHVHTCRMTSS